MHLLEREEEEFTQEIERRRAMEECGFCTERDNKIKKYMEELEGDTIMECQQALEREAIAKGMQSTKLDEKRLREEQKMQMQEKKNQERQEEELENWWHQILLTNVKRKKHLEEAEEQRRRQEMLERRRAYDEQVSSANRERQEALRQARVEENRRLEKIRERMEQNNNEELKRKKEQQETNKQNFIEGHQMKLSRLRNEKMKERALDNNHIQVALEELRREQKRKKDEMHRLQIEKQILIEHQNNERKTATELAEEADRLAELWKKEESIKTEEFLKNQEMEKIEKKKKAAEEYKRYLEERYRESQREKEERREMMERVKRTAISEIQKKLDSANMELKRQMEYRQTLNLQIRENRVYGATEREQLELRDTPFTKKPVMFRDAMEKVAKSPGRASTNPVHPFRRAMETDAKQSSLQLPQI